MATAKKSWKHSTIMQINYRRLSSTSLNLDKSNGRLGNSALLSGSMKIDEDGNITTTSQ